MRKLIAASIVALAAVGWVAAAQDTQLPGAPTSVKFAVIGDNGTGAAAQYEVGRQMVAARERFPFEFVIMLGDNMYGRQRPQDYVDKFERPYAPLLQAGVPFYAALGNHDDPDQRFYKDFNMGGERYYTFARPNVRFFIFDTNLMDPKQIAWIDEPAERVAGGVEGRLLPPPALLGCDARIERRAARDPRAAASCDTASTVDLRRARARLRADHAAERASSISSTARAVSYERATSLRRR